GLALGERAQLVLQRLELLRRADRAGVHPLPVAHRPLPYRLDVLLRLGHLALDVGLLGLRRDQQVAGDHRLAAATLELAQPQERTAAVGELVELGVERLDVQQPQLVGVVRVQGAIPSPLSCAGPPSAAAGGPGVRITTAVHGSVTRCETWTSTVSAS